MYYRNNIGRFAKKSGNIVARIMSLPFKWALSAFKRLSGRRKVYMVAMLTLALLPALDKLHGVIQPYELVYQRVEASEISEFMGLKGDRLDQKIREKKDEVLDTLQKCESGGKQDIAIIFDTNGVASVGVFQWQPHSFQHYFEKKNGMKLTEREAIIRSLDNAEARALAEYVIFETENGLKNWFNCTAWHGLKTKVELIKSLED